MFRPNIKLNVFFLLEKPEMSRPRRVVTGHRSLRRDILVLVLVLVVVGRTRTIEPPASRGVGPPSRIIPPVGTAAAAHDVVVVFFVVGRCQRGEVGTNLVASAGLDRKFGLSQVRGLVSV